MENISTKGLPRMTVLLDADVILELFINRSGYVEDAERLLMEIEQSPQIEIYVTELCLKKISFYLTQPESNLAEDAIAGIKAMLNNRIISIDHSHIEQARRISIHDFDSAVELACATAMNFNAIVTQNPEKFTGAKLPVLSIKEWLKRQKLEKMFEDTVPVVSDNPKTRSLSSNFYWRTKNFGETA